MARRRFNRRRPRKEKDARTESHNRADRRSRQRDRPVTAVTSGPSLRACERAAPGLRSAADEVIRGRAAEQEMIRDLLRRTQQGRGGVLLVEGEPGTGKSWLLR